MPQLDVLGWHGLRLITSTAVDGHLLVEPPTVAGSTFWKLGDLLLRKLSATSWSLESDTADGWIDLNIASRAVRLKFTGVLVLAQGDLYRPAPGKTSQLNIVMPASNGAGAANRIRLGPVAVVEGDPTQFAFKAGEDGAPAYYASKLDLVTGQTGNFQDPLSLRFDDQASVRISLGEQRISIPAKMFRARLGPGRNDGLSKAASFTLTTSHDIAFKNLDSPLDLVFAMDDGSLPVLLNVASEKAVSGVEAVEAGLALTLAVPLPKTDSFCAVNAAQLVPGKTGVVRLRFNGLRNARNKAEEWTSGKSLPLGFRVGRNGRWSSVLLAPLTDGSPLPMVRTNATAQGSTEPMPFYSLIAASQFRSAVAAAGANLTIDADSAQADDDLGQHEWRMKPLRWAQTRPWLGLIGFNFLHGRPGESYRKSDSGDIAWTFGAHGSGVTCATPAVPADVWYDADTGPSPTPREKADGKINSAFEGVLMGADKASHETGLLDKTAGTTGIEEAMPRSRTEDAPLRLRPQTRNFALKPIAPDAAVELSVPIVLDGGKKVPYALYWPSAQWRSGPPAPLVDDIQSWAAGLAAPLDLSIPIRVGTVKASDGEQPTNFPTAILKLARDRRLSDIVKEIHDALAAPGADFDKAAEKIAGLIGETNPEIDAPSWVGLVVFNAPLDFRQFPALNGLIPTTGDGAPRLDFLAISPRDPSQNGDRPSASAGLFWRNDRAPDKPSYPAASPEKEAAIWPMELSLGVRDGHLIKFHSLSHLQFRTFLGIGSDTPDQVKDIDIVGSVRPVRNEQGATTGLKITFAAEITDPDGLRVYPIGKEQSSAADGASFVKNAFLKRVEVATSSEDAGQAEVQIDGRINFRKPDIKNSGAEFADFFQSLGPVSFENLRIALDGAAGLDPRLLKLHYPSLQFDLNFPHIRLLGDALALKFHQLIIDFGKQGLPGFSTAGFSPLPGLGVGDFHPDLPSIGFLGSLDFGSLPSLFSRSLSGFSLETAFAVNFQNGRILDGQFFGIRGFGFDGLNFDFLSFLTVHIDHLELGPRTWNPNPQHPLTTTGSALTVVDASVAVLRHTIIKDGTGAFFSVKEGGGDGYWAYFGSDALNTPLLSFDWGFAARNVDFTPKVAKQLLSPPDAKNTDDPSDPVKKVGQQLLKDWNGSLIWPAGSGTGKGWTFAASLQILSGSLAGRGLIQDGGFAGLSIWGPGLREWFGYNFQFVGIYRKDITPGQDYFYFSITLPAMTIGSVRFVGGEIASEFYTSGDFMVDFGFPWPDVRGGRRWERTIGAIITPGQASGGFYLRKRETTVAGDKLLTIAAGYALQWGLGAAFGGGVFEVWVRIGLYAILEGEAVLEIGGSPKLKRLSVHGAAGVLVEGYGAIDWWVISVRVGVRASAEIRMGLIWQDGQNGLTMPVEASLYVSAYAEACIGGGCFRVCAGIEVGLNLPVSYTLHIG